jgi:hypothetical protein
VVDLGGAAEDDEEIECCIVDFGDGPLEGWGF